jgi:hypothetical protein
MLKWFEDALAEVLAMAMKDHEEWSKDDDASIQLQ